VVLNIVDLMRTDMAPKFGAVPDRPFERRRPAEAETAYALAGWRSTTSLRDGLASTARWYRAQFAAGAIGRDWGGLPRATSRNEA